MYDMCRCISKIETCLQRLRPGITIVPTWDPARQGTAEDLSCKRPVSCRVPAGSPAGVSAFVVELCYRNLFFFISHFMGFVQLCDGLFRDLGGPFSKLWSCGTPFQARHP